MNVLHCTGLISYSCQFCMELDQRENKTFLPPQAKLINALARTLENVLVIDVVTGCRASEIQSVFRLVRGLSEHARGELRGRFHSLVGLYVCWQNRACLEVLWSAWRRSCCCPQELHACLYLHKLALTHHSPVL